MTEIKLTKRYPHSRTEDIVDAYMRGWNDALDAVQNGKFHIADRKTEPQYDIDKGTIKCDNCSENGSFKCSKCDGEMYFKRLEIEDEPQSDARKFLGCVCETCKHRDEEWDSEACDGCCENDDHYEPTISKMEQVDKDINVRSKEPQTDCSWR